VKGRRGGVKQVELVGTGMRDACVPPRRAAPVRYTYSGPLLCQGIPTNTSIAPLAPYRHCATDAIHFASGGIQ